MLLGKYHIVIFKEGRSGSRNWRMRGWFGFLCVIGVASLVVCNLWLMQEWLEARRADDALANAQKIIADQRRQLIGLAGRIGEISRDVQRVQRFDAKLRLMMNMDKEPSDVGNTIEDFSNTYLPLHRQELATRKMQEFLENLSRSTRLEEVAQQDLLHALMENRSILTHMPSIWPVVGFLSSRFGMRSSPFGRGGQFHKGLDISNRVGTPIVAPAEGEVLMAGRDGAYGISVELGHGNGITTKYGHMQRATVNQGQWVKRGEVIGYVGMTGRTTGPHLHYEVHLNGKPVNPMRYILE